MRFFLLWICLSCFAAEEGRPAPEFKAKLFDGKDFSLASAAGKVVIIHFWATWCGPCKIEMPVLDTYYKKHHDEGLELVAVSMDNEKDLLKVKESLKEFSFGGTLAKDASFKSYGRIWRMPLTFLVDRHGILKKDGWAQEKPLTSEDLEKTVTPLLKVVP